MKSRLSVAAFIVSLSLASAYAGEDPKCIEENKSPKACDFAGWPSSPPCPPTVVENADCPQTSIVAKGLTSSTPSSAVCKWQGRVKNAEGNCVNDTLGIITYTAACSRAAGAPCPPPN
ncbi:MAG TPA: hypothetical protein VD997_11560 [Phycisphaerales bacterium]|nr:hypothetical protein [Phycisphaerales bacterium]